MKSNRQSTPEVRFWKLGAGNALPEVEGLLAISGAVLLRLPVLFRIRAVVG